MRLKLLIIIAILVSDVTAQVLNQLDSSGKRTGEWVDFYDKTHNHLKSSFNYANGQRNGKGYLYSKNSSLWKIYYFKNDRIVFTKELFTKGKKKGVVRRINGIKFKPVSSKFAFVFDSSEINRNNLMINGKKEGTWFEVLAGAFFNISSFNEYYVVGDYKNGVREGITRYYNYNTNALKYEVQYVSGELNGLFKIYNDFGNVIVIYNFVKGRKNGDYLAYYDNGIIRHKGTMKDDKLIGEYFEYDRKGKQKLFVKDFQQNPPY